MTESDLPIIPAITSVSGTYGCEAADGTEWQYTYDIQSAGTRSERRVGKLFVSGIDLTTATPEHRIRTPWGPMQRMRDTRYEVGWLLEHTYGHPITTTGPFVDVPESALSRTGTFRSRIGEWIYRVLTSAMGSKSERRIGWLTHERTLIMGHEEGEKVSTPWGPMWWTGPIDVSAMTDYEQGWLLRGTFDRPLDQEVLPGDRRRPIELESAYLTGARWSEDSLSPHGIVLSVAWPLSDAAMKGKLLLDPNACSLNAFGDREMCTKIAVRAIDVDISRQRLADPANLARRYYAVEGADLPADAALIMWPDGDRLELKLGSVVIPLFPREMR